MVLLPGVWSIWGVFVGSCFFLKAVLENSRDLFL